MAGKSIHVDTQAGIGIARQLNDMKQKNDYKGHFRGCGIEADVRMYQRSAYSTQ